MVGRVHVGFAGSGLSDSPDWYRWVDRRPSSCSNPITDLEVREMIRRFARPLAVLSCAAALGALGATPAMAALPGLPTVNCTGSTNTAVSATSVMVTGTATCTGVTTLRLTTTLNTSG